MSVTALMTEAAKLFRARWAASGVTLISELPSPDILVLLDPDQILQALLNLLANGAEAALEDGSAPCVSLSAAAAAGGRVVLQVEDNGPGVPAELRECIGQPFFTTKPQGSGVGLSLARQIARAHGGDVGLNIESEKVGTVFDFIISA